MVNFDSSALDKISWRIIDPPQQAQVDGRLITLDEYFTVLGSGTIKLLLPTSFPQVGDVFILDQIVKIKKDRIRVADILQKIFNFYNSSTVSKEDILHLQVVSSAAKQAEKLLGQFESKEKVLRFRDFLDTTSYIFGGLVKEKGNTYSVIVR